MEAGKKHSAERNRAAFRGLAAVTAIAAVCIATLGATSNGGPVVHIEEDWEAVLNEPDELMDAPQFHTTMSPAGGLDGLYFQVSWNYRENDEFISGGLECSSWLDNDEAASVPIREDPLSQTAETVTWTQALTLDRGTVEFRLKSGHSQSWGSFGGPPAVLREPFTGSSLAGYSTDVSAAHSLVSYGANRVNRLRIIAVRYYDANGQLLWSDTTPRAVYQLQ